MNSPKSSLSPSPSKLDGSGSESGQSRRTFLRRTALGSAALVAGSRLISRASGQAAGTSYLASKDSSTDPLFVSTTKLAELIRAKKISAVEAVNLCLKRIDAVNPKINAVVAFCRERALAEAKAADESLAKGKILGPLHGVPFTIKDSFDTEGVVSTGGTLGRKEFVPGKDATVVARSRAAGAILLGKTNTPEFTFGGGARGTYNLVYGQTYNPYNTAYSPSGSSGGAGAIVASGGAYFDIGTDNLGSIRLPAYANGVAGIKPSYGRSPRTGHIVDYGGPFESWQETGPLTRRVEDLYLILSTIGGPDGKDLAMAPVPLSDPAKVDLKNLRIAFYTTNGVIDPSPDVQDAVKKAVGYFTELGCKITPDMPPKMAELAEVRDAYNGADGRNYIRRLLKKHGTTQSSPGLRLDGKVLATPDFTRLCEELDAIRSEQLAWFEKYDLILCPVMNTAAQPVPSEYTRERTPLSVRGNYVGNYNTNGWPAGTVRVGTSPEGLPVGVQAVANPWRDDVVLAALTLIESKSGGWQKPPI